MKYIKNYPFQGLYAITDAAFKGSGLANQVAQAIAGGARVIQYRDKTDDSTARLAEASEVLAVCRASGVPLLINDDPTLAAAIGADGVHLGKDDARLCEARQQLGSSAIIGVSCYNRLDLAQQAVAQGADYVAFGRFFNSHSKPTAIQADPELLHTARHHLSCPIVAIGGVTADNGATLIEAGADMLAVIRGIFAANDIQQASSAIHALFPFDRQETP